MTEELPEIIEKNKRIRISCKIVVQDEWSGKRFSEFVSNKNLLEPLQKVGVKNIYRLFDPKKGEWPFSLSFDTGGTHVYFPVGEPPTIRRIVRISNLFPDQRPGETLTVGALVNLVKEYSRVINRGEVLDIPGSGYEDKVYFLEFVKFKELKEWRESLQKQKNPAILDKEEGACPNPDYCRLFMPQYGDSGVVREKEIVSVRSFNDRKNSSHTIGDFEIEYLGETKDQAKFMIRRNKNDRWEPQTFVPKTYLSLLSKNDFLARIDIIERVSPIDMKCSPPDAFESIAAFEEYAGKRFPLGVLKKIVDLAFENHGYFFVGKDYEKKQFHLAISYKEGTLWKTRVVAKNPDELTLLSGKLLLSEGESFVKDLGGRNDREER